LPAGNAPGQVQFRKASREFGEREKREPAITAVRVAHTVCIYFLYARHLRATLRTDLSTAYALRVPQPRITP
jgi:hypothetical protein